MEELAERTGAPYPSVVKEARRLSQAGLLAVATIGRSKLVRANDESPYFVPLRDLVARSFGPAIVVAEEFGDVADVDEVYIYGSWAARHAGEPGPAPNDVDVLVVGRPRRDDVYDAANRAERRLGREVNTTIRTLERWEAGDDGFTRTVRSAPLLALPIEREVKGGAG